MYSRKDYIEGRCTHEEYYSQFLKNTNAFELVLSKWTEEEIKKAYKQDGHCRNLPYRGGAKIHKCIATRLDTLDYLADFLYCPSFSNFGDYPTLAGKVCILGLALEKIALR